MPRRPNFKIVSSGNETQLRRWGSFRTFEKDPITGVPLYRNKKRWGLVALLGKRGDRILDIRRKK